MKKNPLDEIEGVGPAANAPCCTPSARPAGVSRASAEDLAKVEGVSQALAERIFAFFRKA